MARGGDGVSFRGTTWWLDFTNAFLSDSSQVHSHQ